MDLFSWLLIGHLVGDWLLQNRWMAEGKQQGPLAWALHAHCLVYTGAVALAAWFSQGVLGGVLVVVVAILFTTHWAIDGFQLASWWGRRLRQSETALVRIGVDQTFHLVVLVGIALLAETQ